MYRKVIDFYVNFIMFYIIKLPHLFVVGLPLTLQILQTEYHLKVKIVFLFSFTSFFTSMHLCVCLCVCTFVCTCMHTWSSDIDIAVLILLLYYFWDPVSHWPCCSLICLDCLVSKPQESSCLHILSPGITHTVHLCHVPLDPNADLHACTLNPLPLNHLPSLR